MEMSLREWLIILGFIIIAAVVIDGLRRVRRARQDSKEMAENMGANSYQSPAEDNYNPELPSSSFRVIREGEDSRRYNSAAAESSSAGHDDIGMVDRDTASVSYSHPPLRSERALVDEDRFDEGRIGESRVVEDESFEERSFEERSFENRSTDDTLKETADWQHRGDSAAVSNYDNREHGKNAGAREFVEPSVSASEEKFTALDDNDDIPVVDMPMSADGRSGAVNSTKVNSPEPGASAKPTEPVGKNSPNVVSQSGDDDFKDRFLKKISSTHASGTKAFKSSLSSTKKSVAKARQSYKGSQKQNQPGAEVDEVIVVNVLARGDDTFDGQQLQNLLEACGMQLGDMSIYHRHEYDFNKGPVQFSMANVMPPGTFAPHFENTPGVCFFVRLPGPDESMQAFDYMIETAQCVVRNLGGELKDENHSVMTAQTIEHCRQRVREFERRQLSHRV